MISCTSGVPWPGLWDRTKPALHPHPLSHQLTVLPRLSPHLSTVVAQHLAQRLTWREQMLRPEARNISAQSRAQRPPLPPTHPADRLWPPRTLTWLSPFKSPSLGEEPCNRRTRLCRFPSSFRAGNSQLAQPSVSWSPRQQPGSVSWSPRQQPGRCAAGGAGTAAR